MLLGILLICIAAVAGQERKKCTNCVALEGLCYNISHILHLEAPFRNDIVVTQLGILRSANRLYYAFEPKISDPEYYKIGFVNLDDPTNFGLLGIGNNTNNFANFDIDQQNNVVYAGGSNGIYKFDSENTGHFLSSLGEKIKSIFYKGNVFFVSDGDKKIVEKVGSEFEPYDECRNVKNFVITDKNIVIFLNTTGLYANKFNTNETVYLSKNSFIRGLDIDLDGVVYAWWIDSIYKVVIKKDFGDSKLVKVAELTGLGSLTFDNENNILFNSRKGLFRLTSANNTDCVDDHEDAP